MNYDGKENIAVTEPLNIQDKTLEEHHYTVFYEPLEEGGYNVVVPAIPEICTFGESYKEARAMAIDAIRCYLESMLELGEEIPEDSIIDREPRKENLTITLNSL